MADSISKPFVEVKHHGYSENRAPTPEEMQAAEAHKTKVGAAQAAFDAAKATLDALKKDCAHTVSYDTAGFPYDSRWCYACGTSQGMV